MNARESACLRVGEKESAAVKRGSERVYIWSHVKCDFCMTPGRNFSRQTEISIAWTRNF
jgi:hypothetical protein